MSTAATTLATYVYHMQVVSFLLDGAYYVTDKTEHTASLTAQPLNDLDNIVIITVSYEPRPGTRYIDC